jgi:hypothetical protein
MVNKEAEYWKKQLRIVVIGFLAICILLSTTLIFNQNKIENNNRVLVLNLNISSIDNLMKPEIVDDFCKTKNSPGGWYSDCGITCPITTNDGGTKYNCYPFSEFFQYSISKLETNGAK